MRYVYSFLILASCLLVPSTTDAQTTGLSSKGTFTVGNIITTGSNATLYYAQQVGTTGLVRGVTTQTFMDAAGWGPLDTGVLTGLSLTGGLVSTTAQISGLLTTSGVTSVTGSLTTLTASGIGTFGGLISTSATISGAVTASSITTTGGITATGGISSANTVVIRNGQNDKFQVGTAGNIFLGMNATSLTSYVSLYYGSGLALAAGATVDVGFLAIGGNTVKITNATTGVGTIQTGGFASNFRAITTTGNLTVTDSVVTTTTNVTVSLPSTSITGQQFIVKNIGTVTNTVSVVGGVKTIDGATTQAIISGAGAASALKFIYDGTNYIIGQ